MSQPASGDYHVNQLLTNVSLLNFQEAKNFVAPQICPVVRVNKQSDRYVVYDSSFFRRDEMQPRARSTESAGGGYEFATSASYYCDKFAFHKDIDDDDRRNADSVFELDREATLLCNQKAMIKMERAFATEIFATSTWTGSTTGGDITPGTKWSASSGDPVGDVQAQQDAILKNTGQMANVMVVGRDVWTGIRNNSDVLDRIKHTQRAIPTEDIVAQVMGLDRIVVANASYTSSVEGASSETNAMINNAKDALLLYVPNAPGRYTPSAAYTFIWNGDDGMGLNEFGAAVKKFRMEELQSDRVEINQYFDLKVTGATLGAYFDAAVA